ncbi:MAPK regulated corepressor interacting protein 2 [Diorhabda carinulata]|uniref:MAPK regulated corepressor interacting protein 2 n=1 Tax=Diorhabda carinulata TaxID=1163345 RepID=UPI0025A007CF|nr:MAPK regulated corepressor interacting protein 2 [Diorhabda carinulata]
MSGPRMGMQQLNGNTRRPPQVNRLNSNDRNVHTQHEELIRYIHDSWSKIEMDRSSTPTMYYQDETNQRLKDFQPFDLEGYWGRRKLQNMNTNKHQQS